MNAAQIAVGSLAAILSLLAGLAASSGTPIVVGAVLAMMALPLVAVAPRMVFVAALIFSMGLSGLAEFYLRIGTANWMPSFLGLALFPAALFAARASGVKFERIDRPGVLWIVVIYILALLFSSIINQNDVLQIIVGVRNYMPFLGVALAVATFAGGDENLKRWVYAILAVGLLQFPFAVHQFLVVAPKRDASFQSVGGGAEAIVGTFGGNQMEGGYTGEMAVFVLLASLLAIAITTEFRKGKLVAILMSLFALGCVALAETKIIFVIAPFAVIIAFWEKIRSSPKYTFYVLMGMAGVIGILVTVYAIRFWSKGAGETLHAFTYTFDPDFMVDKYHRGRVAALFHWWDHNPGVFDIVHTFFGYGMASTLENSRILGDGNAVRLLGLGLDSHAASKLLWDGGVVTLVLFVWIIARTALNAHHFSRSDKVPVFHAHVMMVARAAMFCFLAMLPYQVSVLGGAPMQFTFWFFVGYVEYWRRYSAVQGK